MKRKCVALLSGGLDSMLAIRLMQEQEIEVEALNFKTVFTCCQDSAGRSARDLGVRVTVVGQDDDYLELVRNPRFGYGRGANPCVDCRIHMFQKAKDFMEQRGADFIVSGEVVGQRPMSQKKRDLLAISYHSALEDLLLRPLSARLLPPTRAEREGWVDRDRLFGFSGRGRKPLIKLAGELGLRHVPSPSTGCALTEPRFSRKVFDLFDARAPSGRWDFELLSVGRHFRYDSETKIVTGRNEAENLRLEYLHALPDSSSRAVLLPENFVGPCVLIIGSVTEGSVRLAGGLMLRYAKSGLPADARARIEENGSWKRIRVESREEANRARTVTCG